MVNLIFDTMDPSILWNETDERFKILTSYALKRELSMHFINLYYVLLLIAMFWCFCYLVIYFIYIFIVYMFKNYLFCNLFL